MTTFAPNTEFGKYRILRLLGQGGMADVYEAEETSVGRIVALKVLPAAFARDEERARRFAKEIQASAKLDHPNIVSVFDVGEVDGLHYYTMSVLPGGDLNDRLKNAALTPADALRITREIASALAYAHDNGFVHRDVKPENILFREDGSAVLTDFGIARATVGGTRMTATGLSIGTPHYMSPEQARGKDVDGRSDLYALGVVFHEMLAGKVPFDAQDSFAVGLMHINNPAPQLPPALAKFQPILDRLLAKDPADRYQNGAELIEDLERINKGERIRPAPSATRVVKREQRAQTSDHEASTPGTRHGFYWAAGGAALAAVLAVGLYLWQDPQSSPPPLGGGSTVSRPAAQPVKPPDRSTTASLTSDHRPPTIAPLGAAILHIETTPEDAEVYFNDQRLGTTPFQSEQLPAGEHRLRLVHRYYEPWEQTVRLEDDVVERIEAELQRGTGRVTVITDPPGAEVWIDNQPQPEQTPLTLSGLSAGEQPLEIRLDRYRTVTHTVEILPDDTSRLDLVLEGGDLHEWDGRWLTGEEVIPLLLEAADLNLATDRLTEPENDNAVTKFRRVLEIQPKNLAAINGLDQVGSRYLQLAEEAIQTGQLKEAERYLERAGIAGLSSSEISRISSGIEERTNNIVSNQMDKNNLTGPTATTLSEPIRIGAISDIDRQFGFITIDLLPGIGSVPDNISIITPGGYKKTFSTERRFQNKISAMPVGQHDLNGLERGLIAYADQ